MTISFWPNLTVIFVIGLRNLHPGHWPKTVYDDPCLTIYTISIGTAVSVGNEYAEKKRLILETFINYTLHSQILMKLWE